MILHYVCFNGKIYDGKHTQRIRITGIRGNAWSNVWRPPESNKTFAKVRKWFYWKHFRKDETWRSGAEGVQFVDLFTYGFQNCLLGQSFSKANLFHNSKITKKLKYREVWNFFESLDLIWIHRDLHTKLNIYIGYLSSCSLDGNHENGKKWTRD